MMNNLLLAGRRKDIYLAFLIIEEYSVPNEDIWFVLSREEL